MDMRSLYFIYLPTERQEYDDPKVYNDWVKKNENCMNQNFMLLADKIYEFEARLAALENGNNA